MRHPKIERRAFHHSWFDDHKWLHYDENLDAAFCFTCLEAVKCNAISSKTLGKKVSPIGSMPRKNLVKTNRKIGVSQRNCRKGHYDSLSSQRLRRRTFCIVESIKRTEKNREILTTICSNIRYLARQGIPLRGNWNKETVSELNSNFYQLNLLRSNEVPGMKEWLEKGDGEGHKFTSLDIQNEMLEIMSQKILREIMADIKKARQYSVMEDETADKSNTEQLVIDG